MTGEPGSANVRWLSRLPAVKMVVGDRTAPVKFTLTVVAAPLVAETLPVTLSESTLPEVSKVANKLVPCARFNATE